MENFKGVFCSCFGMLLLLDRDLTSLSKVGLYTCCFFLDLVRRVAAVMVQEVLETTNILLWKDLVCLT